MRKNNESGALLCRACSVCWYHEKRDVWLFPFVHIKPSGVGLSITTCNPFKVSALKARVVAALMTQPHAMYGA